MSNPAPDWTPQPGYTGGTPVLFWDGKEMIEVRMADDGLATAARAAESLNSRYFFKVVAHDTESNTYIWGAYDRHAFKHSGGTTSWTHGPPLKTFKSNSTDPLIMWAAAKGGR